MITSGNRNQSEYSVNEQTLWGIFHNDDAINKWLLKLLLCNTYYIGVMQRNGFCQIMMVKFKEYNGLGRNYEV